MSKLEERVQKAVDMSKQQEEAIEASVEQYYMLRKNLLILEFFQIPCKHKIVEHPALVHILQRESLFNAHTGYLIVPGGDAVGFITYVKDKYGFMFPKLKVNFEVFETLVCFCESEKCILEFIDLSDTTIEDYLSQWIDAPEVHNG
jgi:hypothetical protein